MKFIHVPLVFLLPLLLLACVNEECDEEALPRPVLNVAFKKYTDASRTIQKSADTLINITRTYAEGLADSSFYPPKVDNTPIDVSNIKVKNVALYLNPKADSTIFHLQIGTGSQLQEKKFTVTYTRQPRFISQACGYEVRYSNLAVNALETVFDDEQVIVPEINPIRNEIHIQLYFKP